MGHDGIKDIKELTQYSFGGGSFSGFIQNKIEIKAVFS
jgi:hypothetical protein